MVIFNIRLTNCLLFVRIENKREFPSENSRTRNARYTRVRFFIRGYCNTFATWQPPHLHRLHMSIFFFVELNVLRSRSNDPYWPRHKRCAMSFQCKSCRYKGALYDYGDMHVWRIIQGVPRMSIERTFMSVLCFFRLRKVPLRNYAR